MTKKTNFFDRLMEVLDFYGVNNLGDLAERLGYPRAEKLYRLKREPDAKPHYDFLLDLKRLFPSLDLNYLISGQGSIERDPANLAAKPEEGYAKKDSSLEHLIGLFASAMANELKPTLEEAALMNKAASEKIEYIYSALSKAEYENESTKLIGLLKALEKLKE